MWFSLPATSFQTGGRYNWSHFYFNYNSLALKKLPMEICKPPQMPPLQIPWILMWPGFPSGKLRPPATIDICCCYRPKVFPKQRMTEPFSLSSSSYFSFWNKEADLLEFATLPLQNMRERRKPFEMKDKRVQALRASFCSSTVCPEGASNLSTDPGSGRVLKSAGDSKPGCW